MPVKSQRRRKARALPGWRRAKGGAKDVICEMSGVWQLPVIVDMLQKRSALRLSARPSMQQKIESEPLPTETRNSYP